MAKKKKNQGTQKVVKIVEASNASPPYETVSNKSNTKNTIRKNKHNENTDSHLCKCKDKKKSKPKTWESITKMYGNTDTTEVWDGKGKDPERFFRPKKQSKGKDNLKPIPEQNNDSKDETNNKKDKSTKKQKSVKKSVISFYRKRHKRKHGVHSKNSKLDKNKEENEFIVKDKAQTPVIRFEVNNKKAALKSVNHHDGTGDACVGGPCRKDLTNKSKRQERKKAKAAAREEKSINQQVALGKQEKAKISTKGPDNDIPKKYIMSKRSSEKVKELLSKCSIFRFIYNQCNTNKLHNMVDNSKGEPVFEMKVDSLNMHVLNSEEIKDKVKNLGKINQNRSCICPSRMKLLNKGKHNVCNKGICERALGDNRTRFDCKCKGKRNSIVCEDSNCDLKTFAIKKKRRKKCNLCKLSKYKDDRSKPPIKVVLDRTNMNILNSQEIGDMFKRASNYEICPTGICKVGLNDPNIELKCKCIGKKMIPLTTECTDETCATTMQKCKLSDMCSRLFSNSEYRVDFGGNKIHGHKRRPYINKISKSRDRERHKLKAKSDTINKRITNRSTEQLKRQEEEWLKTFCECDIKRSKPKKERRPKTEKKKRSKQSKEKQKCKQLIKRHQCLKCRNKNRELNWKQYIIKCMTRKRVRCEKKLKEKEKEFKKNEKKAMKENRRIQKKLDKTNKIEEPHWNCLTKLFAGILNLGVNLIKGIFTMTFSLLTNPIGSYVYVRERAKDVTGTIKKIIDWIRRTWSNKTTKVSQSVKNSDTMNVIADQIEESAVYDAIFANKGKTKAEKLMYEKKKRMRQRRIQKRHDQALFGCRHMLLTTMRKTPCLWFYHICPDLYPQCLSLVAFMRNFFHIIIYLMAFICWTPCIVTFELCRAFLCCFLCTG